jgi:hypothetical protein
MLLAILFRSFSFDDSQNRLRSKLKDLNRKLKSSMVKTKRSKEELKSSNAKTKRSKQEAKIV